MSSQTVKKEVVLASREDCTGCGMCAAVCPNGCIHMEEGFMGHLFPVVNETDCVQCGKCNANCAVMHHQTLMPIEKTFASWVKDEEDYNTTASGGIATALSQYIIRNEGVVYGCAMLPGIEVRHIRVDNLDGIGLLKSSKYVQSQIIDIIPSLKQDVAQGRQTLFIGTPCQVAAVKTLYKIQPDNLYLVDLICHGVPSLKLLHKHVHHVAPKAVRPVAFFRENTRIVLTINDGGKSVYRTAIRESRYRDAYLNGFFDGYTYRDSCYHCAYAQPDRVSDLTIGDFWGLKSDGMVPHHPNGCSAVLCVSKKGSRLIDKINADVYLYERQTQEAVDGNSQLRTPMKLNKRIRLYRRIQRIVSFPGFYRWVNVDRIVLYKMRKRK